MADKIFTDGMIVKRHTKAPKYVICSLSFKAQEFIRFLEENEKSGWVNVEIKESQNGKLYGEVNAWEPKGQSQPSIDPDDDIAF